MEVRLLLMWFVVLLFWLCFLGILHFVHLYPTFAACGTVICPNHLCWKTSCGRMRVCGAAGATVRWLTLTHYS